MKVMTRSMQATIAKLDSLPRPRGSRMTAYEQGLAHGKQAAYRTVGYIATALAAVGVVAWVL